MSDIVLIQLDFKDSQYAYFPIFALEISSELADYQISTSIFDINIQRHHFKSSLYTSMEFIPRSVYSIYGITVYYGMLFQALLIAKFLKKREPHAIISLGGSGVFTLENDISKKFGKYIDKIYPFSDSVSKKEII